MKILFLFILVGLLINVESYKIDFGLEKDGANWLIVNDGVMGGRSEGDAELRKNTLYFYGKVSLENNGGFASLRTPYDSYDLSKFTKVNVRYRSRGQSIGMTLNKYQRFYYPNYKIILEPSKEWTTKTINLLDFKTYRLGELIDDKIDNSDLAKIIRLGFITNDKKASIFEFEVDYIEFL